jgi:hypothetical protein
MKKHLRYLQLAGAAAICGYVTVDDNVATCNATDLHQRFKGIQPPSPIEE